MTDEIDRAQEREQRDRDMALLALRERIDAANAPRDPALDGLCVDCGEPIEDGRLKVLPLTSRCADCAHLAEQRFRGTTWKR